MNYARPDFDEFRAILGAIQDEEYQRRAKLRSYRNVATILVSNTSSTTARRLAWEAIEWISPNLYAPAPIQYLDLLISGVSRLLRTALTFEDLEDFIRDAERDASN